MVIVGVDTGGTFTDFVYYTEGKVTIFKIPSTPENPATAVLKGLKKIEGSVKRVVHGSTVATNTLLERKGALTALITNSGFEDVLEIGRQNRKRLYDLHYRKPEPLVPRQLRFGIKGRVNFKGEILEDIDESQVEKIAEEILHKKVESVAVCLLHSYANCEHERRVKEILRKKLKVHISLSHEILPEFREYERTSTTVINAYVSPVMESYIGFLEKHLKKGDTLNIMQSNGGVISSSVARKEAVRTILSGPAAGVTAAFHLGKLLGIEKIVTFDMGGTSTDVSLIEKRPTVTTEAEIDGLPLKVSVLDIHTIGAGGGSIAWIDEGGILRVGPRSAGANPGPICYGKGGKQITVTDANLFLGRLIPNYFLGGQMRLYPEKLKEPFTRMARLLKTDPLELAEAILAVTNSNMERALRRITVQRGYNPADFTLFSFGGAGGLHAVFLAKDLGIKKVLIPPDPGIFSAMGLLMADVIRDYSLTIMLKADRADFSLLEEKFRELEEKSLKDLEKEGFLPERVLLERSLDMRYKGQSYEITVPFCKNYVEKFHEEHERLYTYKHETEVEIVNLRLRATLITDKPSIPAFEEEEKEDPSEAFLFSVKTAFGGEFMNTRVFDRKKLKWGNRVEGPALIVEYSSTTLIPPFASAYVDKLSNLLINL